MPATRSFRCASAASVSLLFSPVVFTFCMSLSESLNMPSSCRALDRRSSALTLPLSMASAQLHSRMVSLYLRPPRAEHVQCRVTAAATPAPRRRCAS